jgi:hypothetical protein
MHLKISIRAPIFLDLGTKKFFFLIFFMKYYFKKKNYTEEILFSKKLQKEEILFSKELNFPFPKCRQKEFYFQKN